MAMVRDGRSPDSSVEPTTVSSAIEFQEKGILTYNSPNRTNHHQGAWHCHALAGPEPLRV